MVLQKGISFFLLPIYTLYLSPADYGVLGVSSSLSSFISIFITFSLGASAGRFYYSHNKDEAYSQKLYGTIITIVLINSIFWGSLFILLHKWIIDPFLGNIDFYPYIFLGFLNVIVTPLYQLFQEYLQTRQEGLHFGINSMCFFILNVAFTIIALCIFNSGVLGILISNLATAFIFFIYAVFFFLKKLKMGVDSKIAKESFKYALPLVPHALANWSNGTIDRLLVNGLKSESVAGLYNLGQQYSSVMNFICNAANQAYVPWFYDKVNYGTAGLQQIKKMAEAIIAVLSLIAIVMSLFAKELLGIMVTNPDYDNVWKIIPFLVVAYLFHGLYFFFVNVLFLKDTKIVFTITIATMAINIGFNVLLIPSYGYMGSGFAFLVTNLFQSVISLLISMKQNKEIRFNWLKMYAICFLTLGFSLSSLLMENMNVFLAIGLKILLVLFLLFLTLINYKQTIINIYSIYVKKKVTR